MAKKLKNKMAQLFLEACKKEEEENGGMALICELVRKAIYEDRHNEEPLEFIKNRSTVTVEDSDTVLTITLDIGVHSESFEHFCSLHEPLNNVRVLDWHDETFYMVTVTLQYSKEDSEILQVLEDTKTRIYNL
jgi:hypothetical protein